MYQHRGPASPVGEASTYYKCPRCLPQELSLSSALEEVVVQLVVPHVAMDYFYYCGLCGYPMDEVTSWCKAQAIEMPLPARITDLTYDRVAPSPGDSASPLIDFGGFDDDGPMPQSLDREALAPGGYQRPSTSEEHQGSGTRGGRRESRTLTRNQRPGTSRGYQGSRTDSGHQGPGTPSRYQDPRTPGGSQPNPHSQGLDWHSNARQQHQQDYPGDNHQEDDYYPIYPETYRFKEYRIQDE